MPYTISGFGTQAITAGTVVLYVSWTSVPGRSNIGNAYPTDRFQAGLVRFFDGEGYGYALGLSDGPQRLDVPAWATSYGYWISPGGIASITESAGTPIPGGSISVFPNTHTPTTLFTQAAGSTNGQTFIPNVSGLTLSALRYYRPATDTILSTGTAGVYEQISGTLLSTVPWSPINAGWNTISISPISLTSGTNYMIAIFYPINCTHADDTGGWGGSISGGQVTLDAAWYLASSSLTFPTNSAGNVWIGLDFVIT